MMYAGLVVEAKHGIARSGRRHHDCLDRIRRTWTDRSSVAEAAPALPCIATPTDFAYAFLGQLGDPQIAQNVQFIVAWEDKEGGNWKNTAAFNPMNTTQPYDGSVPYEPNPPQPNDPVQAYKNWNDGMAATVVTITNGYYPNILSALADGSSAQADASALTNSPWGTGDVSALLGQSYSPAPPPWQPRCGAASQSLPSGQTLGAGSSLWSADSRYEATMQDDGNFVIYGPAGATWSTGTDISGSYMAMQGDGNLVVYSPNGTPQWSSGTAPSAGDRLFMQSDGNLVIYTPGNVPLWTQRGRTGDQENILLTGQTLAPGQGLWSLNGQFQADMQTGRKLRRVWPPRGDVVLGRNSRLNHHHAGRREPPDHFTLRPSRMVLGYLSLLR